MRRGELFWGGLLILVGLLFLAGNLWGFNAGVFFWPLVLIAVGVWILWGTLRGPDAVETERLSLPLEGEDEAHLRLTYGAGRLSVTGDAAAGTLLEGRFTGGLRHTRRRVDGRTEVTLRPGTEFWTWIPGFPASREWQLRLTQEIPLSLSVEVGASDTRLDLRSLQVTALDVETGASSVEVWLPKAAGYTRVDVDAGAASVVFRVPENVAARIHTEVALSGVDVDRERFPRTGKVYLSPNYATAEHRVEIHVEGGVGSLTVQ
ncbi:MAG: toast rack family protein [Anaerolineae bacterium]